MSRKIHSGERQNTISRREMLEGGSLAVASGLMAGTASGGSVSRQSEVGTNIYQRIGVRPLINCKGTFTIISGSLSLPQVKRAMDEASRHYVHLDELMEAVGKRLAQLTGAEWGIVTAGCSAAETLATCACIAGGSPERLQRLPDLMGMKDEIIVPLYSRNVYDHAIRMLGVRIITVQSIRDLERAIGPRTAMIYILACPEDTGPLGLEAVAKLAGQHDVPIMVDAAAENLTPEVHLGRGADLVAYSGGKALRGPQCAGLLLGRKDLCQAAWLNSAPHHAFGRSMKVGKEEIIGMLAAVEAWYQRDHAGEWKLWESWLDVIAREVSAVDGVTTRVIQPESLSNNAPRLRVEWSASQIPIGGEDVLNLLLDSDPRIILARGRGRYGDSEESYVEVMPWMMEPGDDRRVGARLRSVLSNPPEIEKKPQPEGEPANVAGVWEVEIKFVVGADTHLVMLEQDGSLLKGVHQGMTVSGKLSGSVMENQISFRSSQPYEGTRLGYSFSGQVRGNQMGGEVDLGEYGKAAWEAHRMEYA